MLLLHLDGVGRKQLEFAMERGYAPTLRGLLERGPYRLSPCRAGAPTSTPAFQAGMLYGVGSDIPGYTWFDKRLGREIRMDRAEDARMLERDLAARGVPLLQNGSVYCSIFSGGAPLRRWALSGWNEQLCAEDFGMEALSRGPLLPQARDVVAATLVHSATLGRIFGALGMDVASGAVETARWVRHIGSMQHEPKFLLHRVLTECRFAEFAANSCVIDIARGTPIVYACFIGYDEYAHRRGPYSRMALLKLWELDRMLGRIIAAAKALPELNYELYLFSDHGQAATRPAEEVLGESLGEHLIADGPTAGGAAIGFGRAGGGETARAAAAARWYRRLSRVLPGVLGTAALAWARHKAQALDAAQPEGVRADGPLLVVPAGDIAHVYSTLVSEPVCEQELRARHPGLLERCAHSPAIGFALVRGERGPIALRGDRRLELDRVGDALENWAKGPSPRWCGPRTCTASSSSAAAAVRGCRWGSRVGWSAISRWRRSHAPRELEHPRRGRHRRTPRPLPHRRAARRHALRRGRAAGGGRPAPGVAGERSRRRRELARAPAGMVRRLRSKSHVGRAPLRQRGPLALSHLARAKLRPLGAAPGTARLPAR
jgi:hypothetical protein